MSLQIDILYMADCTEWQTAAPHPYFGDQTGLRSLAGLLVRRVRPLPSAFIT
jgi:hypothetical protein